MSETYIAKTEGDRLQLPPAIADYVRRAEWLDILVSPDSGAECITLFPLPHPDAPPTGFTTRLEPGGALHLSPEVCRLLRLDGQSVMVRVEGDVIRVYLRRVFQTLGFRPD